MKTLSSRQEKIVNMLLGRSAFVTGRELAERLNVTDRTIRNDLSRIEEFIEGINGIKFISIRGKGYKLDSYDDKEVIKLISDFDEAIHFFPDEPVDRVNYILRKLLLSSEYIKIEELIDQLFVSRSTIQNDLKDIKVLIEKYGLSIINRPNYGMRIKGDEKKRRYAISEILVARKDSLLNISNDSLFPSISLEKIRDIILSCIKNEQLNLSDLALNNLIVHIAIACQRIEKGSYVKNKTVNYFDASNEKEYLVAKKIISKLSNEFHLSFPEVEIAYIAMHLLGIKLFFNKEEREQFHQLDKDVVVVVKKMITEVEKQLNLGIVGDKELETVLSLHLKPVIHRYNNGMNIRNPMLEAIKINYALSFEAAVIASRVIEEVFAIDVDEDEIGYIALHFGAAIERSKEKNKPKKCLIVCTTGLGSSKLLFYKLRARFNEEIYFIGTTELHNLSSYDENEIDFIISTVPLPDTIRIPYILIDSLIDIDSISKVEKYLQSDTSQEVENYFKKDIVHVQMALKNRREVIEFIGEKLIDAAYVLPGIIQSTLEREKIASTSYGNLVAIPHPLKPFADETFWTLLTLKEKIDWNGKPVQLICFLHVANNNTKNIEPLYNHLLALINDRKKISQLIAEQNKEKIVSILKNST